jgi:hypothetical protein
MWKISFPHALPQILVGLKTTVAPAVIGDGDRRTRRCRGRRNTGCDREQWERGDGPERWSEAVDLSAGAKPWT